MSRPPHGIQDFNRSDVTLKANQNQDGADDQIGIGKADLAREVCDLGESRFYGHLCVAGFELCSWPAGNHIRFRSPESWTEIQEHGTGSSDGEIAS